MRKVLLVILAALLVAFVSWWVISAPQNGIIIAPKYVMGEVPESLTTVWDDADFIGEHLETMATSIPGYDEVILQENQGRAFVTAIDGWIWIVDLETKTAERFVDPPLMAAGARMVPGDDDRMCFCSSYLHGATYPEGEQVGVYELKISTKEITPLLTRVPLPPPHQQEGVLYTGENRKTLALSEMNESNSQAVAFCNDLDISADGKRIYFSEPFAYPGASMGGGAIDEAISLGNNGRLWMLDREANAAALVAQNFTFIDGVLVEPKADGTEESLLIAEATKFRVLRFYVNGEKAGQHEVLWENLPAIPDGLDRDPEGRIWLGLLKERSGLLTWSHANPWVKPLMMRLPLEVLPVPESTAIMGMSPDGSKALYYADHDGAGITDISVVVPGKEHLYLATVNPNNAGLHRIPYPPLSE